MTDQIKPDIQTENNNVNKDDILHRLQNVYDHLNDEGYYVKANTIALAIDYIKNN